MSLHPARRPAGRVLAGLLFAGAFVAAGSLAETRGAAPVAAPVPAEEYLLRYKFPPGDLVYYDVELQSKVTVKGKGLEEVTTNQTNFRKHFRVISVDDEGSGLLELAIDHVTMRVQFGDSEPVEFDSRSKEPPPRQFRAVKASIGRPRARTRISANGELKQMIVLDRPAERLLGQLASAPATEDDDPSHNFLLVFPQERVQVGDEWSDRIEVQVRVGKRQLRPVTLLRKSSLKSVEGNLATIETNTVILTPIRDPGIRTQLIQRTPTCTATFDLERGLIVSKTTLVNARQVGGITDTSSMHVVSKVVERLAPDTQTAAAQPRR